MIAGGKNEDYGYLDTVVEYDIDANTYNPVQSLPDPIRRVTLVKSGGYMYSFGGYDGVSEATVARIALTLTSDWEKLEDMETPNYDVTVVPYN